MCTGSVLRYEDVCLCDPGTLIYQRPHLLSTLLLAYDASNTHHPHPPTHPQKMALLLSDVNESSRIRTWGCKQRVDGVSGLFMRCCHPHEGWALILSNQAASRPTSWAPSQAPTRRPCRGLCLICTRSFPCSPPSQHIVCVYVCVCGLS